MFSRAGTCWLLSDMGSTGSTASAGIDSGTSVTPVVGSVYNSITDQYDPTYGAPNSGRDPTFQQLDIRVDRKWIHDLWTLTWYLDLQNVYNHVNSEGPRSYNFDYTKSGLTQGLPVLAIAGLKAEF